VNIGDLVRWRVNSWAYHDDDDSSILGIVVGVSSREAWLTVHWFSSGDFHNPTAEPLEHLEMVSESR